MNLSKSFSSNLRRIKNVIRYGNLDPVELYYSPDNTFAYIENAKVACTSIKRLMYNVDTSVGMDIHELLRQRAVYKQAETGAPLFTVVRNPFERLASCYFDKVQKRASVKSESIFDLKFYKIIFFLFSGKIYRGKETSFEEFVDMVLSLPDWISDRHIRSQSSLLKGNRQKLQNLHTIKLENIRDEWEVIESLTRLKAPSIENKSSNQNYIDLYSTKEVYEKVCKRYREDIRLFNYTSDYSQFKGS